MANYCSNCGNELRERDKFCPECGTPVSGAAPQVSTQPPSITWEYCEILLEHVKTVSLTDKHGWSGTFVAKAVGPTGVYYAAHSTQNLHGSFSLGKQTFSNLGLAQGAVNGIVQHLTSNGWEPTDKDDTWWHYKFRRQVKS